jgi:hypothetical protein
MHQLDELLELLEALLLRWRPMLRVRYAGMNCRSLNCWNCCLLTSSCRGCDACAWTSLLPPCPSGSRLHRRDSYVVFTRRSGRSAPPCRIGSSSAYYLEFQVLLTPPLPRSRVGPALLELHLQLDISQILAVEADLKEGYFSRASVASEGLW